MKYLRDVSTLKLDIDKCTGCKKCIEVCPRDVFELDSKKIKIEILDNCIECGACVKNCKFDALKVNAGVGCASAIINGWITGSEPSCDCSTENAGSSCC